MLWSCALVCPSSISSSEESHQWGVGCRGSHQLFENHLFSKCLPCPLNASLTCGLTFVDFHGCLSARAPGFVLAMFVFQGSVSYLSAGYVVSNTFITECTHFSVYPHNLMRLALMSVSFCFPPLASFEELCGIDLYGPDAYVDRAKLSSFVSACKHLHRAGVLHDVLPAQVTTFCFYMFRSFNELTSLFFFEHPLWVLKWEL